MASSFPVHFCSAALHGASGYTHQDAAPLRVLSRLLSSKYLHVEIREKGTYSQCGKTRNSLPPIYFVYLRCCFHGILAKESGREKFSNFLTVCLQCPKAKQSFSKLSKF